MKRYSSIFFVFVSLLLLSCKKDKDKKSDTSSAPPVEPKLVFKFKFDSTQARLNNLGQPSALPPGHASQNPRFNKISAHYVELAPNATTALGSGIVLYRAAETTVGGSSAIDFSSSTIVAEGEPFLSIPIKDITPGQYPWLRVSLAYQNYDIRYKINILGTDYYSTGTVASFIGFNTYISSYAIKTQSITVNANKAQGYWAVETSGTTTSGQAPAGSTTVPNPLAATSPIPAGSCVVTGAFANPLTITGNETKDIIVTVSLSTNQSFEWNDTTPNGWFEPAAGEQAVDMGIRGLVPTY